MKNTRLRRALKFLVVGVFAVAVVSLVVMVLWNLVMPAVFELKPISFWQALGLLILSKIFFGAFRGRPGRGTYWRRGMLERWEQMTPEQRDKFRQGMRHRCGGGPVPEANAEA